MWVGGLPGAVGVWKVSGREDHDELSAILGPGPTLQIRFLCEVPAPSSVLSVCPGLVEEAAGARRPAVQPSACQLLILSYSFIPRFYNVKLRTIGLDRWMLKRNF